MKKILLLILTIIAFFALATVVFQTNKVKVTVCDYNQPTNCHNGEGVSNLNRVLFYDNAEVLHFTRCDIDNSKGTCVGKSDKSNATKWNISITSKSDVTIHSDYDN